MPQLINKSALQNLDYDADYKTPSSLATTTMSDGPTVVIVFAGSDLNAAAYHLAKSMSAPFASAAVVSVLLQESVREQFLGKLRPLLKQYDDTISSRQEYQTALKTIQRLQAATITGTGSEASKSPTLVCDFLQEQLGSGGVTGVVTLHTFRTAKEAIALCSKETVKFVNASIWNENHSCAYELAANLKIANFYINCFLPSLEPIAAKIKEGSNFVTIANNYHYETLSINELQKTIVFPIGSIFAN